MKKNIFKSLAELVYNKALTKYLKRIDYLVGANNELMKELEQYERVSMKEKV